MPSAFIEPQPLSYPLSYPLILLVTISHPPFYLWHIVTLPDVVHRHPKIQSGILEGPEENCKLFAFCFCFFQMNTDLSVFLLPLNYIIIYPHFI